MAAITVVVGPPCAGKSTYVAAQKAAGDVVVDFDHLARALGSTEAHAAPEPVRAVAFAARKAAIKTVLDGVDAPAWIIHTNPWPGQLATYESAGADVVVLDPGLEECLARAASDSRPEGTEDAIRQWYDSPPLADLEKRRTAGMGRKTAGMRTKEFAVKVKAVGAADGLQDGQFLALVSVFNTEDSIGDVVRPGAFTQSLAEWAATGDDVPVIWSHQWSDPFSHIGRVLKATETLQGLEVLGQIEDREENPTAAQVYRLLAGRRVKQFSFAYDVNEGGWISDDEHPWGGYYELRRLDLYEVGPCLIGVNSDTELLAAKSATLAAGAKAGRVLSQANYELLANAHQSIGEVLAAAQPEKARETATPKNTPEETGQLGSAAASGDTPPAQPSEPAPAKATPETTPSTTEDETTPDLREASPEGAAKAGADSLRLRHDLELLELEVSLTE